MTESRQPSTPRHELTILAVADLERSLRFYRQAFDWPTRVDVPVFVEFDLGQSRSLGLYDRQGYAANTGLLPVVVPAGEISGTELYLRCDDLDAAIARLQSAGG